MSFFCAKRNILIFILRTSIFIACAFLFACAKRESVAEKSAQKQILILGNAADPATLDPSLATGLTEFKILIGLFEGLVALDETTLQPIPAVAKKWNVSSDNKVYTFYLDENAKWSDGEPVTADDFVFAWRRALNPRLGAEYASMLFCIKNAQRINSGEEKDFSKLGAQALDSKTLRVELENPTPYFLSMLYHNIYFPLPQKTLVKFQATDSRNAIWTRPQNMVCNGAFVLSDWRINDRVSIRKNPNYKDSKNVRLQGIDFLPISNINTEDRAFRAGQLHISDSISAARIDFIKKNMPQCLRCDDWFGVYYYIFNTQKPPLDDSRVRMALAMSIDRKAIIDSVLKGGQKSALSFMPEGCQGYALDNSQKIKEDVAKARELLVQAGYGVNKKFPTLRISYNTSEQHKPIAEAIQNMWKQNLGIDVELYNLSWPAYLAARREKDFDVMRASWVGDYAAVETFLHVFLSNSALNHSGYKNKDYDELLENSKKENNRQKSLEMLKNAEAMMLSDAPIMPIYFYSKVYLVSPMVRNWGANLLDYHSYKNVVLDSCAPQQKSAKENN